MDMYQSSIVEPWGSYEIGCDDDEHQICVNIVKEGGQSYHRVDLFVGSLTWIANSFRQLSKFSNDFGIVTSNTNIQTSAPNNESVKTKNKEIKKVAVRFWFVFRWGAMDW